MSRRKAKYKKYKFAIPSSAAIKFEEFCKISGTTPNKFIRTIINDFIQNNDQHSLHYFYKKENHEQKVYNNKTKNIEKKVNQLSLFDDL
ncbi:MAG TPA: hypothetical protein PLE59_00575 [Bacteroidales bacterium]|jgi:hypothetical protein|nr:hypothetical protein [Bacteroidales bacterium]HOF07663.1 hypothetical protein [Bacteroidales bacterium]HON97949.1 hypothetical protein [Bacteroidales bacterium]HOS20656.1 hypothetical protein [Bacteroidales bacterium]HOU81802.1 hypothetical protein [Bacteroidales bacterium]